MSIHFQVRDVPWLLKQQHAQSNLPTGWRRPSVLAPVGLSGPANPCGSGSSSRHGDERPIEDHPETNSQTFHGTAIYADQLGWFWGSMGRHIWQSHGVFGNWLSRSGENRSEVQSDPDLANRQDPRGSEVLLSSLTGFLTERHGLSHVESGRSAGADPPEPTIGRKPSLVGANSLRPLEQKPSPQ